MKMPAIHCDEHELIFDGKLENAVPLRKYKSHKSGLTIYIAEVEGPLVHGLIDLATEASDDDGLPHTLEHLVFLGSEDYPYKGVLDLVANRCLASGTNAWTDLDSTCYTISTAGSEGFLNILPIYLDHILYPTLTESGYTTEVHHVNGKGEDEGVVYCEMQGVENTSERLVYDKFLKTLYPESCGYSCNTGGALKNLQESITYEKVKAFHRSFYRPENTCIIVVGKVSAEEIFKALKPFEDKIVSKSCQLVDEFVRPWQKPIAPILESVDVTLEFPSDDEASGLVRIGWRAPSRADIDTIVSLNILLTYLYDTSTSPLQKAFIEIDDPLCSEITLDDSMLMHGYFAFDFENVPVEHLPAVKVKFFEILSKFCSGEMKIDELRLKFIIQRKIWDIFSKLESKPKDLISTYLVADYVYGNGNDGLEKLVNRTRTLESLLAKDFNHEWWQNLLKKHLLETPNVSVIGMPSCEEKKRNAENENERIKKRVEEVGEEMLKKYALHVENSVKINEIPPPASMISAVPIPNVSNISFHPIIRNRNFVLEPPHEKRLASLSSVPYRIQVDDVHSKFATIYGILDTSKIPQDLKLFLPLLLELLLESPVLRNGELVPHETINAELLRDTVGLDTSFGFGDTERFRCGPYPQMAFLYLQVDTDHYVEGVTWLHDLLFGTRITAERIKIVAKKMLNNVARLKRDGYFVVRTLSKEQRYLKGSNTRVNSFSRQHAFLTLLLSKLNQDPEVVIDTLEKLKNQLTSFDNLSVHIATDVDAISEKCGGRSDLIWKEKYPGENPREPKAFWVHKQVPSDSQAKPLIPQFCHELVQALNSPNSVMNAVVGLGSVESSYLFLTAPCVTDAKDPYVPALAVLCEYLCQLEGPLWKVIRGLGLAYGYNVLATPTEGALTVGLYRSTDVVSAFKKLLDLLESYSSGKESFDSSLLESARSSLVFTTINQVATINKLSHESFKLNFNNLHDNFLKDYLKRVLAITIEDLQLMASKFIPVLMDPSSSILSVCCGASKVEAIKAGFLEQSRTLKAYTLEDSFIDNLDDDEKRILI